MQVNDGPMRGAFELLRKLKPIHLCVALTVLMLIRATYIVGQPEELRVTFMPDDAFYYFTLARNFADLGQWTSDGGISHTTGFHLLNAYVLAAISWMGVKQLPEAGLFINTLAGIASCWILTGLTSRHFGRLPALLCAPIFTSYPYLSGAVSGMEWGFCLFFICAYLKALAPVDRHLSAWPPAWHALLWGLLMELSRSDAGLVAAAMLIAATIFRKNKGGVPLLWRAFTGQIGALIGLALTFVHTYTLRGALLTGSAEVKHEWASKSSFADALRSGYRLFLQSAGLPRNTQGPILLALIACTAVFIIWKIWRRRGILIAASQHEPPNAPAITQPAITLSVGALMACAGYFLIFSQNAAVLFWYSALIIPELAIITAAITRALLATRNISLIYAETFGALLLATLGLATSLNPIESHHQYMRTAAQYVSTQSANSRFGSWNAGIIGYYSPRGMVINLDGLVNDDVIPYIKINRLDAYITKSKICYLIDFEKAITRPEAQRTGGFLSQKFNNSIKNLSSISNKSEYLDSAMQVFEWDPGNKDQRTPLRPAQSQETGTR